MSNLKPSKAPLLLNQEEIICGRKIRWSEKGRILVYCKTGENIVEIYDHTATALKGVRENLTASNGETTASTHVGGKSWMFIMNEKFVEKYPEMISFDFENMKLVPGQKYIVQIREEISSYRAYVDKLPDFLEQDATYRVYPDGTLGKVRSRTFENRNRFDFPALTVIPDQHKRGK